MDDGIREQDPAEKVDRAIDWSSRLGDENIKTGSATYEIEPATTPALLLPEHTRFIDGKQTRFRTEGGVHDTFYRIKAQVEGATSGQRYRETVVLYVRNET